MNNCLNCGAERPEPSAAEWEFESQHCRKCHDDSPPTDYNLSDIVRTLEARIEWLEDAFKILAGR